MADGGPAPRPLDGLRVIEAATLAAGPMVGTALGEFGAEVIKVEPPGAGDPMRTWGERKDGIGVVWKSVSRNKRCVTLDLRQAGGQRGRLDHPQPVERSGGRAAVSHRHPWWAATAGRAKPRWSRRVAPV